MQRFINIYSINNCQSFITMVTNVIFTKSNIKLCKTCGSSSFYTVFSSKSSGKRFDFSGKNMNQYNNQRLPGACNRSPGSKLLSITTQLHCGGHLGGRAGLPDTILEEDHSMTIPSKCGSNWATGSRKDGFYVNFP